MDVLFKAAEEHAQELNEDQDELLKRLKQEKRRERKEREERKAEARKERKRKRKEESSSDESDERLIVTPAKKKVKSSQPAEKEEEEEEEEEEASADDQPDLSLKEIQEHAFVAARANGFTINSISVNLSRVTLSRKEARQVLTKKLFCQVYELIDSAERQNMRRFGMQQQAGDTGAENHYTGDFDFVGLQFPQMTIGFNLDDVMEALYGPVKPSQRTLDLRKNKLLDETDGKGEDEEHMLNREASSANVSVCYFKRLSPLIKYTALDVNRVAPIARSHLPTLSVAAQMAGYDDDPALAAKNLTTIDRRFLRQNDRVMPVHLLPLFIANQSNNVRSANVALHICDDLSRQFEARLIRNVDNALFVATLRQLRANVHYLIEDSNHRALAGELLINKLYAIDSKYLQLRERIAAASPVIDSLLNVVATDKMNILQRLEEGYNERFVQEIVSGDRPFPEALASYAFSKRFVEVNKDKARFRNRLVKTLKEKEAEVAADEQRRAAEKAEKAEHIARIKAEAAEEVKLAPKTSHRTKSAPKLTKGSVAPVAPPIKKAAFKLDPSLLIGLDDDEDDN